MITTLRFINMSVVLYKIQDNRLYIASDSIIIRGGYVGSKNKKLQHIKDNVFFGAVGIVDTIQFMIEYLKENDIPTNPSLLDLRKYFCDACKLYCDTSYEPTKFDMTSFLFIGCDVYMITINSEYESKIEIIKMDDNIGGIGWYDMGFGCMLSGDTPTEALHKTIPYYTSIEYPIHQIVYDIENEFIMSDIFIDKVL